MNKTKKVSVSWKIIAVFLSVLLLFMGIHVQSVKAFASGSLFGWGSSDEADFDTFKAIENIQSSLDFDLSIPDGLDEETKADIQKNKDEITFQLETGMEFMNQTLDVQNGQALAEDNSAGNNLNFLFSNILNSGTNAYREGVRWWEGGQGVFNDKIDSIGHEICGALNVCTAILHILSYAGLFPTPDKTVEYLNKINEIRTKMGQYHDIEIKELKIAQDEINIQEFVAKFEEMYNGTVSLTTSFQLCGEIVAEQTQLTDCRGAKKNINEISDVDDFNLLDPTSKNVVIGFYSAYDEVAQKLDCNDIITKVEDGIAGLLTGSGESFKYVDVFINWSKTKYQYTYEARDAIFDYNCFIFNILEEAVAQAGNMMFMYYRGNLFSHALVESELDKYRNSDSTRKTSQDYNIEYLSVESIMKRINETTIPGLEKKQKELEEELERETDEQEKLRIVKEIMEVKSQLSDLELQYAYYENQLSTIDSIKKTIEALEDKSVFYKNNADNWCHDLYLWGVVTDKDYPASESEKDITTMMMQFLGYWQIFAVQYSELSSVIVVDQATSSSMEFTNISDAWISACNRISENGVTINFNKDLYFPANYNLQEESVAVRDNPDLIKEFFDYGSLHFNNTNKDARSIDINLKGHSVTWGYTNQPIFYVKNIGLNIVGNDFIEGEEFVAGTLSGARSALEKDWSYGYTSEIKNVKFTTDGINITSSQKYTGDSSWKTLDAYIHDCEFNNVCNSGLYLEASCLIKDCVFKDCKTGFNGGAINIGKSRFKDIEERTAHGVVNSRMPQEVNDIFNNEFILCAILNCEFNNCSSTKSNWESHYRDEVGSIQSYNGGGAIYANGGPSGIYNCNFEGNKATKANGGAIFFDDGIHYTNLCGEDAHLSQRHYIKSCNFHNNYAKNKGGAIFGSYAIRIHLWDTTITNNEAGNDGGAIYQDSCTWDDWWDWVHDFCVTYYYGLVTIKDNKSGTNKNDVFFRLSRSEYEGRIEHSTARIHFDDYTNCHPSLDPRSVIYVDSNDWHDKINLTRGPVDPNVLIDPSCFKVRDDAIITLTYEYDKEGRRSIYMHNYKE